MSPTISCSSVYKIFGNSSNTFIRKRRECRCKKFQEAGCIVGVNASFDVNQGEMLVVMGLSDLKVYSLRCISRLTDATSGKILIDGEDICS